MNEREKKLVILLGATAFVIVNLALYFKVYSPWKEKAHKQILNSQTVVEKANLCLGAQDQFDDEIRWLDKYRPKTAARQDVEAALQRFAQTEAMRNGLTIKPRGQRILPAIVDPGLRYGRARVEQNVSGRDDAVYRWLYRLQTPGEFRAITDLRLVPNRENDTLLDCKVVVEEWFVPQEPGTDANPTHS
jgi:hypothetical protein